MCHFSIKFSELKKYQQTEKLWNFDHFFNEIPRCGRRADRRRPTSIGSKDSIISFNSFKKAHIYVHILINIGKLVPGIN